MPLFINAASVASLNAVKALSWSSTVEQELTGAGGAGVQAFNNAGCVDTLAGGLLRDGDVVIYDIGWEVTGKSTATALIPNLYWGGAASGVACLKTSAVSASALGLVITAQVRITIRTAGASPVWNREGWWISSTNATYQDQVAAAALTTQPTNADIVVQASAQLTGVVDANDKVKLRSMCRRIVRATW